MNRFSSRRFRICINMAVVALVAALAAPAAAQAGQDYIVQLKAPVATTCEQTIIDISTAYKITVKSSYTSSLCAFSAPLSTHTAEQLRLDIRVESVTKDSKTTTG